MTKWTLAAIALTGVVLQTSLLWAQGEEAPPPPAPVAPVSASAPASSPPPTPPPPLLPPPAPTAAASPSTTPSAPPATTAAPPRPDEPQEDSNPSPGHAQRVFGWTALGVGGATVVAGLVIAGVTAAKLAELDCCDDRCPPEQHEDAEAYNDLRLPAGLTLFAGAALIGLGVPFVLVGEAADDAPLSAVFRPGGITLRGSF